VATKLPDNLATFSVGALARATGGRLVAGDPDEVVRGVVSDSRRAAPGTCFVALAGERFDGHAFVSEVLAAGARAVLVARGRASVALGARLEGPPPAVIEVDDTLRALGDLGRAARVAWGGRVVGVAGSAGKTTTTQAIAAVLRALLGERAVHATSGNLNNRVGVPHVLLALEPHHELAVIELGTNAPGEVGELARVAAPSLGVLTLVGVEHAEGLGDLDAIEAEEAALYAALGPGDVALGNGDDERVARRLAGASAGMKLSYGLGEAGQGRRSLTARVLGDSGLVGTRLSLSLSLEPLGANAPPTELGELDVALPGRAGIYAALAAVATATAALGAPPRLDVVSAALRHAQALQEGRLVVRERATGGLVIDDSYNANPPSMLASIELARRVAERARRPLVLVLGEMRELGALAPAEHDALGHAAADAAPALVVGVAGDAARTVEVARARGVEALFAETSAEAAPLVAARAGDAVVLVKGSRGVRTEVVVRALGPFAAAPDAPHEEGSRPAPQRDGA
jgi:UDP-N-acetylmuramoyl-tripeptide--D-alanyl-D-alanine ligase